MCLNVRLVNEFDVLDKLLVVKSSQFREVFAVVEVRVHVMVDQIRQPLFRKVAVANRVEERSKVRTYVLMTVVVCVSTDSPFAFL